LSCGPSSTGGRVDDRNIPHRGEISWCVRKR